uniref:Uncharacterized protein n=1 Tax=Sicyonia whispovirus TaxID=2984283 RepID=A0A9C7F0V2_9VIRU|nr:MAG: hypothetical protein [Sicyonia whispovirus]
MTARFGAWLRGEDDSPKWGTLVRAARPFLWPRVPPEHPREDVSCGTHRLPLQPVSLGALRVDHCARECPRLAKVGAPPVRHPDSRLLSHFSEAVEEHPSEPTVRAWTNFLLRNLRSFVSDFRPSTRPSNLPGMKLKCPFSLVSLLSLVAWRRAKMAPKVTSRR